MYKSFDQGYEIRGLFPDTSKAWARKYYFKIKTKRY